MDRIKPGYSEAIEAAYKVIPQEIHKYIRPHILTGTDPVFAGLHEFVNTKDSRAYAECAHVAYPQHQTKILRVDRRTTVVLPYQPDLETVVHEFGHVLHESVQFDHDAKPVSDYATMNTWEAFAEAFTSWLIPGYAEYPARDSVAFFERLKFGD